MILFAGVTDGDITNIKIKMKEKYWNIIKSGNQNHVDESSQSDEEDEEIFRVRSKNQNFNTLLPSSSTVIANNTSYVPENAEQITKSIRKVYNISESDFFSILYRDADDLLKAFYEDLISKGTTKVVATQHKNQIKLIWETLTPELELLPKNAFSNFHLLKHAYHVPSMKIMGTKDGVQAGTLRARYTSLSLFVQFIRRNEIFAGMSRQQLHAFEDTLADFNKELNPYIKQRKVDVRRFKVKNLLLPSHFIAYGRSDHVQNLIKVYANWKESNLTQSYAIRFRDYLISTLVIGNGLRPSNIVNLTIQDLKEVEEVEGYKGHKVLTNSKYKTSTIYGEKFIVIPTEIVDQCWFYVNHLRILLNPAKSKWLFVPNSSSGKLTATNVSSSLTTTFRRSKVLGKTDHQRVSCTRIRCGIATYACNEGEMDVSFFARHFMKNREATTSLHYNLLSNRRHALNIAMQLYNKFSGHNGEEISVDDGDELAEEITKSVKKIDTSTVLGWIQTRIPDMEEAEIKQFREMLQEMEDGSTAKKFYGVVRIVVFVFRFKDNFCLNLIPFHFNK